MAQPAEPSSSNPEQRRAQILDAALDVFAQHGFRGATIKRIAQRAGLKSPALIYWYFPNKDALLEGLLSQLAPMLREVRDAERLMDLPPEQVLPRLVRAFIATVRQPVMGRFVRLIVGEVARHPAVGQVFAQHGPLVVLDFLERYLLRQVELGRLKEHDVRGGARAFMGMLVVYALGRELFPSLGSGFPAGDAYADLVVGIFLSGLRVGPPQAAAD